jgi:dephospho-CoA kinase
MKLNEGIHDKWIFKAVLLAGGPGSGKNFVKSKLLHSFKNIDPDLINELVMKREKIPFDYREQTPKHVERKHEIHQTALDKMEKRYQNVVNGRLPIVINRTGYHYGELKKNKERLESIGYETKMVFVDTPIEKALERNLARKRKQDPEKVKGSHRKIRSNIEKFKLLFGKNFYTVDNSGPYSELKPQWDKLWTKLAKWMEKPVNNPTAKTWKQSEINKKTKQRIKDLSK